MYGDTMSSFPLALFRIHVYNYKAILLLKFLKSTAHIFSCVIAHGRGHVVLSRTRSHDKARRVRVRQEMGTDDPVSVFNPYKLGLLLVRGGILLNTAHTMAKV